LLTHPLAIAKAKARKETAAIDDNVASEEVADDE